jgi:hypothetical protein
MEAGSQIYLRARFAFMAKEKDPTVSGLLTLVYTIF